MHRILLVGRLEPDAEQRLAAAAQVVRAPSADEATLVRLIADCDALIVRTHTRVNRELLAAGRRLRVVGVAGVGTDLVDTAAAEALGIHLVNTPGAATAAVADLTLALILLLLRPVPRLAAAYQRGEFWAARAQPHGPELCELTVGIVGMGRIGSRVGRICAAGFGARVLYNDIVPVGPFDFPAESVDKPTLWARSDVVSLHVPLTDLTRGLVNSDVLARMRPAARLINTARGAVVDTMALTAALQDGRLAGAALDVTDPEPLPPDHPLFACDRCLLTPHVAARTPGGLRRMSGVVDDVLAVLSGLTGHSPAER
ncbi:MAG: NAD(P)-dependent oxidoreductase [Planctomycetota bacterium]